MWFAKEPSGYLKSRGPVPGSAWVRSPHCFISQEKFPSSPLPPRWKNPEAPFSALLEHSLDCLAAPHFLSTFLCAWQFNFEPQKSIKTPLRVLGGPLAFVSSTTKQQPCTNSREPSLGPLQTGRDPRDLLPTFWKYNSKLTTHSSPFPRILHWNHPPPTPPRFYLFLLSLRICILVFHLFLGHELLTRKWKSQRK